MAIDFQLIEAYDVDIENFSYDVSDMVDSIYIGPQGELLEKLELFNHSHGTDIGVTKSFTLKPGGYDEIKKAYSKYVLRYDMKPRGIASLFDRIAQYGWRQQHFKRAILEIDNRMKNLKHSGMRWQDNTGQFEEEFDKTKSSIISGLEQTREMYPSVSIQCKIIPVSEGRLSVFRRRGHYGRNAFPNSMFSEEAVDFILMIYLKIQDMDMMVHIMDGDSSSDYRIPMEDVYIASGTYLLPLISRHWGRTTPMTANAQNGSYSFFLEAMHLSKMCKSSHPYISRSTDKYGWDLKARAFSSNICTGNMESEIRNSLLNNEIMAHIVQLISWVTNYYVPQTHPLNRINMMRHYGDDIRFIQWRGDLNSTSTDVFRPQSVVLPNECNFPRELYLGIFSHARNRDVNGFSTNGFNSDSVEWPLRMKEYMERISLDDMPCNNCGFKSECNQWNVLQLVFKDSLTPEEESCLGILYEFHEFETYVLNRLDTRRPDEVLFIEEAINQAWRSDLDENYFTMMLCHKMSMWWSDVNDETFTVNSGQYRKRMRMMYNMSPNNRLHLFKHHYLNHDSKFEWRLDTVSDYHAPPSKDEPLVERYARRQRETADEDTTFDAIEDWLHQEEPDREDMTPEQRAIQWAVSNGGAQNL